MMKVYKITLIINSGKLPFLQQYNRQNELIRQANEGFSTQSENFFNTDEYKQIVNELGIHPSNLKEQREYKADGYAIDVLNEYYGKGTKNGSMPERVKVAIKNYQKRWYEGLLWI